MRFDHTHQVAGDIATLYREAMPHLPEGSATWKQAKHTAVRPVDYMRWAEFNPVIQHLALAPGMKVLDVSSPQGLSLALACRNPQVQFTYINITDNELDPYREIARLHKLSNIEYRRQDVRAMPFSTGEFDRVISVSVIEHVAPEVGGDVRALLEIRRVLATTGHFLMTVPCKAQRNVVYVDGAVYERAQAERNFFAREYDLAQFDALVQASGFQATVRQLICEKPGLLAIDEMEWGRGRGRWWGGKFIGLRYIPERLLGISLDAMAARRHLWVADQPDGRIVNVFAALKHPSLAG